MIEDVERTARSAARAWRRARAIEGALLGGSWALLGIVVTALGVEAAEGLRAEHLGPLLGWLLLAPVGAAIRAGRAIEAGDAAAELDHRGGLADRLGTALEFAGDDAPLAALQRVDAAGFARATSAGALFPAPWRRHLPRLLVLLVLALSATGAGLTFELRPRSAPPAVEEPADDVLASIERSIEAFEERGNKAAVALLTDLDRTIRRIRAREDELRRTVKKRAPKPGDVADLEPEELPPLPPRAIPEGPRITADDLARLEQDTVDQLALTDAQQAELVSDLFAHSRKASDLMHQFHHDVMHEAEVTKASEGAAVRNPDSGTDSTSGMIENSDLVDNAVLSSATNNGATENIADEREDMIRRDLSDEAQAAHDRAHDTQESFNQFLRDFVKDVQAIVAEAAVGRKKKPSEGREVQVDSGQGVADKTDAMAQSGFEEAGDIKRNQQGGTPEDLAGGASQPAQGPPPEGAQMAQGSGDPSGPRMQGDAGGETSAGAEGAGTGAPSGSDGLSTLLQGLTPQRGGRLEQALGQLAQGRLPPETRDALFDRLARHKVNAGLASEADDVLVDYFAEAEELMVDNADALPPLFRDYAQSYFDAIRPGGPRAATP